jgi:acyl carrier protein
METFLKKLAEILEVDKIEMDNVLSEFEEWDSLTSLSIIATIDADFNVNISAEELLSASTVHDLVSLIKIKTAEK